MIDRVQPKDRQDDGGVYFSSPKTHIEFIPTGCKLLDCALGGGWAERRVANIIGDKSTGKTLLCIEACVNFANKYPRGKILYREAEAAFDQPYAEALGMPLDRIDFGEHPLETVEDMFEELEQLAAEENEPVLYICDSLDALTDRAEKKLDINDGTYGAQKAKMLSRLFRSLVRKLASSNITVIIVSQIRDKIGAMAFQRKWTRTGGKALDFYASQILFLNQTGKIVKERSKIKRVVGISIKAMIEKNKVGVAFREAEFEIHFGYGIDDLLACLDWLKDIGRQLEALDNMKLNSFIDWARDKPNEAMPKLHKIVEKHWYEIERDFLPKRRKYG